MSNKIWIYPSILGIVAISAGAIGDILFLSAPPPKPHVTDADVQAYLRRVDMSNQVHDLHNWIDYHPDIPRTLKFPEIKSDPILWDFTENAVLRGLKRTWTWGGTTGTIISTSSAISTASTFSYGMCSPNTYQTIIFSPAAALSGGYP